GRLPLPGEKSPQIDLRFRGVTFRGRPLPDGNGHATLGATVEAWLRTTDGRLSAKAVAPARGGFDAEVTLVKFDLSPLAAALPPHLADFHGEVSGHFEASQPRTGPHVATASVESGFVAAAGLRISTSEARASVRGDKVDIEGIEFHGDDGSRLRLSGRGNADGSAVEALVRFEIPDFSAFAPLLPPAPKGESQDPLGGSLSGDVKLAGSLHRPRFTGTIRARDVAAFGAALARLDATLKPDDEGRIAAALRLEGLSWGAYRVEDANVDALLAGNDLTAEGSAFGGRVRLKATGSVAGARPFDATATLDALDLSPFLRAAGVPDDLAAKTSGSLRMRGTVADLRGVAVDVDLDKLEATHPKWNVHAEEPVRVVFDRSRLDIRSLRLSGPGFSLEATGGLPFEGSGTDRLAVTSSFDLAVLLPFVDELDRASGRVSARLDIGGSLSKPVGTGSLTLEDALLDGPDFPTPVEKLTGTIVAKLGEIRTESVSARLGGGTVVLAGVLGLAEGKPTRIDASLRARDLELEARKDLQIRAGADLTAKGEWASVLVAGEVRLEDATWVPALDLSGLLKAFKARKQRPAAAAKTERSPFVPRVSFDIALLAKDAIHIEGNLGDAELGGTLRLKGTPEAPVVLGTISATRGTIYMLGSTFDLSRCHISFSDPLAIDPELDVVATTTKNEEEITIRVDGRASSAQLLLSSSKGKSQADIISLLLGGSGTGSSSELAAAAARMAMRGAAAPVLGALSAHTDLEIVPLPTTPEGENFLFSVGKDLGGGISATYYKGVSGETTDAIEIRWRLSSRARGRLKQNQDGSISSGFRIRHELD
ncbi:MAG TPA: translocation/assembly module TamB domain-containing protein, partial [Thermoanaerobaculia bacterium]|nr:translocation/assembly module TamB domain-containing protein [Thermoanaerobaculia bacterium]